MVSSSSPLRLTDTKVCLRSSVTMRLTVGSVVVGARSQPAHP
ncbi:Uncharacterised protein [Mycobacteroides abscessus subsp. abscessus]|nr:Uncharacterised protein [Mycobacteroides abscessus subsp. abscessus]SKT15290.1 Uncharacterised protein [Mycobacteroides abscessus subsp. abscessus]SKU38810.1 Uncharacterised protein [Mycobacteroides abscessus subsp. abscessus]SKV07591.1 Uncharacterised protein [Mycobacteroides abscessus subsp. abscessus]